MEFRSWNETQSCIIKVKTTMNGKIEFTTSNVLVLKERAASYMYFVVINDNKVR